MDVIRGTTGPKRKRRWWTPRPHLHLVGESKASHLVSESKAPRTPIDSVALAMIELFGIFLLAWIWVGTPR